MSNYPYQQPPYAPPPYAQPTETSTMAVISLISGILGWLGLFGIGPIIAIITGHIAKGQIRDSMGRLTGSGMATFGLVLGYSQLIIGCCAAIIALLVMVIFPLFGLALFGVSNSYY